MFEWFLGRRKVCGGSRVRLGLQEGGKEGGRGGRLMGQQGSVDAIQEAKKARCKEQS
jgi:hypothetical protein